uniref:SP32.0 n=1 Tax=Bemisia tabaci TaxID=7038 RepID=A0A7S5LK49_BEMTA|nr:SP32.0 [Bemisia tabaci]
MHPRTIIRVILPLFLILLMRSHSISGKDEGKGGKKGGGKGKNDTNPDSGGKGKNDTDPNSGGKGGPKDLSIPDKCGKDNGMVPKPCTYSYSGCKLKGSKLNFKTVSNDMIQMGECWANTRVLGQRVAFFVPVSPSVKNYGSEGGPYGSCHAYAGCPTADELEASDNPAEFCFIWETNPNGGGNKKKGNNGTDTCNPKCPGSPALPMPIVCPSTLKCCYSADWYEKGGKLEKYGNLVPTYKGVWFPLKGRKDHKPLFCPGLNLGCPTPTYRDLQLHHLEERKCDVSKCKGGGSPA